ncbi:IPT/TIG domain-containing protein [Streptantibioticus ferralitis]|uniref:IPT/TIG domain-containing protein n=1 Tax=Streptantibioticus ferralitis TaxID=236510 RepID=A0ABT5ZCS1_9ACTN|nr:IPT/TIG domain-containing protein [Streptantibioticus ferralitis]MDF2261619.1 IPT/TIG domain-containing protein [Streptantibioticus ferralitis]
MPLPVVSNIVPGFAILPTPVVIFGSNLLGARSARFGPNPGTILLDVGFLLLVVPPPGCGTVDVTVTTAGGTSAVTPSTRFTYLGPCPEPVPPTVTSVLPNRGPDQGGQQVAITGTGFVPGKTQVFFG